MAVVQVPPAPGSSGQQIDVFQLSAASTTFREIVAIGSAFTSSGLAVVTTSGGLLVNVSSGTVTLSSATALSSGIVTLSSVPTVTATAATNPWSSAPGFNIPFVSASSGLVQISGTPLVNLVGTSSAVAPVTSSGGLLVSITGSTTLTLFLSATSGGLIPGSTGSGLLVELSNVDAMALTSGLVTISSDIAISSGLINLSSAATNLVTVTSSSNFSVSAVSTVATNPWSSAPGFNLPMVSASSGLVQISGSVPLSSAGVTQAIPQSSYAPSVFSYVTSSSVNSNTVQSGNTAFFGYAVFNTTGAQRHIHLYNTSSAPTVGSTANFLMTLSIPGSTMGGGGANLVRGFPLNYSTRGLSFTITDSPLTTSTGTIGQQDLVVNLFYV